MKSMNKLFMSSVLMVALGGALYAAPRGRGSTAPPSSNGAVFKPTLTTQQMLEALPGLLKQGADDAKLVRRLILAAKKTKDPLKRDCVNEKLLEVKGLQNRIDDSKTEADNAAANGDDDTVRQAFAKVSDSVAEVKALKEAASMCLGVELSYDSEGNIVVTSPNMPDDVTDDDPFGDDDGLEDAVYVTPFY